MWGQKSGPVSAERAERLLMRIDLSEAALRNILYHAPEPYKERAWRRLQPLNPRAIDLVSVLYSGNAKYRARVANRMIAAGVGFGTVLHHAPAWIRKKAARALLTRESSSKELWLIIMTVSEPYRSRAWSRLFKNGTTRETRQWILDRLFKLPKSYRKRICELFNSEAEALLARRPKELIPIREYLSSAYQARLREKLFSELLEMYSIFRDIPEAMREIVKDRLFVGAPPREAVKQCLRVDGVSADIKGQIAAWILGHKLPQRDEEFYREILRHAPEPWKERAWEMLITDSHASRIMPKLYWQIPDAYRPRYAEWVFANRPSDDSLLRFISKDYPEPHASEARERLAALSPNS